MYNLDASTFCIALVLLHEYFTQKAKLPPYNTKLSLQTWLISFSQQCQCNDRTFFKTASLQVRFFTINDIIASVVVVNLEKRSVTIKIVPLATHVQSFASFR